MINRENIEVGDRKLSVPEVSVLLGIEEKTIRNWMAKGQIPFLKIMGGAVRIRQSVVDKILADAEMDHRHRKSVRSVRAKVKDEAVA